MSNLLLSLLARNFLVICCNFFSSWVDLLVHLKSWSCHDFKQVLSKQDPLSQRLLCIEICPGQLPFRLLLGPVVLGDLIIFPILVTRVSLSGIRFPSIAVLYVVFRIVSALSLLYVTFDVCSAFFFRCSTHLSLLITASHNWPFIFLAQLRILSIEMFDPVQCIALSCAI